jgi:hypothetical protein
LNTEDVASVRLRVEGMACPGKYFSQKTDNFLEGDLNISGNKLYSNDLK